MGSSSKEVSRVTMFKLSDPNLMPELIEDYKTMSAGCKKDGKPYILSIKVGKTDTGDPRSKGYSLACFTTFASMEDMKYYDDVDEAHQAFKRKNKPRVDDLLTVFTEDVLAS